MVARCSERVVPAAALRTGRRVSASRWREIRSASRRTSADCFEIARLPAFSLVATRRSAAFCAVLATRPVLVLPRFRTTGSRPFGVTRRSVALTPVATPRARSAAPANGSTMSAFPTGSCCHRFGSARPLTASTWPATTRSRGVVLPALPPVTTCAPALSIACPAYARPSGMFARPATWRAADEGMLPTRLVRYEPFPYCLMRGSWERAFRISRSDAFGGRPVSSRAFAALPRLVEDAALPDARERLRRRLRGVAEVETGGLHLRRGVAEERCDLLLRRRRLYRASWVPTPTRRRESRLVPRRPAEVAVRQLVTTPTRRRPCRTLAPSSACGPGCGPAAGGTR
jgi:hypothetical protein